MDRESSISAVSLLGVLVGLTVMLVGTYVHSRPFQIVGGVVILAAMGLLTAMIAGLEPASTEGH